MESTAAPIEELALSVGFDSPATFRHHFTGAMRTSPSAYRRAFRVPA
ncbi:helix-turn-helix domain-containing protein [Streptosporangium roseum]|nr:helix-turn-helix domain-containing protein [Streptosporangium roseum]